MPPVTTSVVWILLLMQFAAASSGFSYSKLRDDTSECSADSEERWSYRGGNGPVYWGEKDATCYGQAQSPIDIDSRTAELDMTRVGIVLNNYEIPVTDSRLVNNGHTIQMNIEDGVERSIVVEGFTYFLRQLHFHWGDSYDKGSEHTIDGNQYAMEIHLVHTNGSNNKIAVLGGLYQEQATANAEMQNIVNELPQVRYKDDETRVASVNLLNLLPENSRALFRYQGSLTTPGCAEGVVWSVLASINHIGTNQMAEFRNTYSTEQDKAEDSCTICNNFRPVQPLNERPVTIYQ